MVSIDFPWLKTLGKQKKLGLNGNVYAKYRETQFWAPQVGFGIPNHVLAPPNEVPHDYEGF